MKMRFLTILLAVFTVCQAVEPYVVSQMEMEHSSFLEQELEASDVLLQEWEDFKLNHNKQYANIAEEKYRLKIFMENKIKIEKHNAEYEQGLHTYTVGMNRFGDKLIDEVVADMNDLQYEQDLKTKYTTTFITPENVDIPDEINWVEKGAVTGVKDQLECGSCWAFSATGALEGQHFRKTGKLVSLSEQNLIDCTSNIGNHGCKGGDEYRCYLYIKENKGIDTEDSYPYQAVEGKCRYNASNIGATDTGYAAIESGNETKMMEAVATVGPLSVRIDARNMGFIFYVRGVYCDPQCSSEKLTHEALVVGYGRSEKYKMDYWLVKNSWGVRWGNSGYIPMCRNRNNNCGIATDAIYPLV